MPLGMSASPNARLRRLLGDARWNSAQLAAAVRVVAAERGDGLACDRSTASRWLRGTMPRTPASGYLLEALSRRLGRPVTATQAGLTFAPPAPEDPWQVDPLRRLADLATGELDGRVHPEAALGYQVAAATLPSFRQLAARTRAARRPGRRAPVPRGAAAPAVRPVGAPEIAAMRGMASAFGAVAEACGGARARRSLAAYLGHDVVGLLTASATPTPDPAHLQLWSAASQLAAELGSMCADDDADAYAQHYHRTAAYLAADAQDPAGYAYALGAMSAHAHELGHHGPALRLARQAVEATELAAPAARAQAHAQLAVAEAHMSDRAAAMSALAAAEGLGASTARTGVDAALLYHRARTLTALGDLPGAVSALTRSLRERPVEHRRARVLTRAHLAEAHLRQGHLERALPHWRAFLDEYPGLMSTRATRRLVVLRQSLRPHAGHPAASELLRRAAEIR